MKYSLKQKPSKKTKRSIIIIVVILLLIGGGFFVYNMTNKSSDSRPAASLQDPKEGTPGTRPDTTNYDGPTPEEVQAGNQQKENNEKSDENQSGAPASSATVAITDASQYDNTIEVRGYVSNLYEAGTCTATFAKSGSTTVTTTSTAIKDASVIQCGANDTNRSKFDKAGTWQLTLSYTSASGVTGSATRSVEIK